jgi:hypothetical protein
MNSDDRNPSAGPNAPLAARKLKTETSNRVVPLQSTELRSWRLMCLNVHGEGITNRVYVEEKKW